MAQQRIAVEWGFGLVKSKWKLLSTKVSHGDSRRGNLEVADPPRWYSSMSDCHLCSFCKRGHKGPLTP